MRVLGCPGASRVRPLPVGDRSQEDLEALDAVISGKDTSEKARLAYQYAPRSLVVEGDTPLKVMFDSLSEAVHRKGEDAATAEALALSAALEFTIRELGRHLENRREFAERIRRRSPKGEQQA